MAKRKLHVNSRKWRRPPTNNEVEKLNKVHLTAMYSALTVAELRGRLENAGRTFRSSDRKVTLVNKLMNIKGYTNVANQPK